MTIPVPSDTQVIASPALPDAVALGLRAVHRAASELRRGTPVLLRGAGETLLVAAAETVGAQGLSTLAALGRSAPVLLLAPARAAAFAPLPGLRPVAEEAAVAFRLPPALFEPAALRGLADPTAESLLPEGTRPDRLAPPALAGAALALAAGWWGLREVLNRPVIETLRKASE